jgi:hypothetical protein
VSKNLVFRVSFIARHVDGDRYGRSEGVPLRYCGVAFPTENPPFGAILIKNFSEREY